MSGPRIGVAFDDREMVARPLHGAPRVTRMAIGTAGSGVAEGSVPTADELTSVLAELRAELERAGDVASGDRPLLTIALLAPLAQFRRIELPPLPDDEVESLLRRDAARYFPGGAHRRVVAASPRGGGRGAVSAVAAPARMLQGLVEAADATGFRIEGITAGWNAMAADLGDADARIAIARRGELQVLSVERGVPVELRRTPVDPAASWMRLDAGEPVTLLGDGPELETVRSAFAAAGVDVVTPTGEVGAAIRAARGASNAALRLVPDRLREARADRKRRLGVRLLVIAALLVVAAVVIHHAGVRGELATVRDQRAAIAEEVAPLLAMRDSLTSLNEDVRAIREVSRRSYDWATAVSEIALLLPRESWITSVSGSEGILEFEAAGERAGAAIDALRAARSLSGVRLEGLVERELENGETVVERFRIGMQVRVRGAGGDR